MVLINKEVLFKMSINREELKRLIDFISYLNMGREKEAI